MVGIDIIEIERIAKAITRPNFMESVFTPYEIEYYHSKGNKAQTLAGIFCAKEAVSKACGTGVSGFRLTDVEVNHTDLGQPYIVVRNRAALLFEGKNLSVSISHNNSFATAVCMVENKSSVLEKSNRFDTIDAKVIRAEVIKSTVIDAKRISALDINSNTAGFNTAEINSLTSENIKVNALSAEKATVNFLEGDYFKASLFKGDMDNSKVTYENRNNNLDKKDQYDYSLDDELNKLLKLANENLSDSINSENVIEDVGLIQQEIELQKLLEQTNEIVSQENLDIIGNVPSDESCTPIDNSENNLQSDNSEITTEPIVNSIIITKEEVNNIILEQDLSDESAQQKQPFEFGGEIVQSQQPDKIKENTDAHTEKPIEIELVATKEEKTEEELGAMLGELRGSAATDYHVPTLKTESRTTRPQHDDWESIEQRLKKLKQSNFNKSNNFEDKRQHSEEALVEIIVKEADINEL